ncbi:MAG: DMT family transporter [Rhodospirillaceae bacterium]|nr:DMT family transporter [Rhodospirillaceae bacterium]
MAATLDRLTRRWEALPDNARGALWVIAASAGFSAMAALVKVLGQSLDSFQIAFFRCLVGLAVLSPLLLRSGLSTLRTTRPVLHLGRAAAGMTAMFCGFYAFTHLPLATATAITFTKPLFMIVVAVLFLGEVVRWRRWTATAVGFCGVLVMVRPGVGTFEPAMLVSLAQALSVAIAVALVKSFPRTEGTLTILFYFAILSTLISTGPALLVWRDPTWEQLGIAVVMGGLGVSSQAAIVRGYRIGEATAVAPFDYSRLLFAAFFGFVLFAEVPDVWTWLGAGVIIASTLYIARREAKTGAPPKAGPAPH